MTIWAPLLVVALVPLFILVSRNHQIGDPDTFWHIRAGDYLLSSWQFSGADPWSPFTVHPWVLHEWLPELVLSLAGRAAGLSGVAWVWYVGTVLVALAFYASCRAHAQVVVSAIATVLGPLGATASLTPPAAAGQHRPRRCRHRHLAAYGAGRSGAMVAGPDDLGVGLLARHVVHQSPRRRCRRRGATARPRPAGPDASARAPRCLVRPCPGCHACRTGTAVGPPLGLRVHPFRQ